MKVLSGRFYLIILLAVFSISVIGLSPLYPGEVTDKKEIKTAKLKSSERKKAVLKKEEKTIIKKDAVKNKPKVTFIELGATKCIPCKMMQPVMKAIGEEYKGQVDVVFYDVWTEEGRPFAEVYNINLIPTQVFLDEKGKEFSRHEGYFPKEEIVKLLESKGIKKTVDETPKKEPEK